MLQSAQQRIHEQLAPDALVLDVGAGASPFPRADWIIDLLPYEERVIYGAAPDPEHERFSAETWVVRDICDHEPWPFADDQFDFAVCSHTLEDVRDPIFVCHELARVAKAGYIEVPSRLEEQSFGFQGPWTGWGHHRWLIDLEGDELTFVLKHHIVNGEPRFQFPAGFQQSLSPEERVLQLWWTDGFRYRERMFYDIVEFDNYLSFFVRDGQAARRPAVTVVLPWLGGARHDLSEAISSLEALSRRPDDVLVVASEEPPPGQPGQVRWRRIEPGSDLPATWNAATADAPTDWVLLLAPGHHPETDLINQFFIPPPGAADGVLIGGRRYERAAGPAARYLARRETEALSSGSAPEAAARAGSLLVRRAAWADVGGFVSTASAQAGFAARLEEAGWSVGARGAAAVNDTSAPVAGAVLRRRFELGRASAEMLGRSNGSTGHRPLRAAVGHVAEAVRAGAGGHPRQAAVHVLDALGDAAEAAGRAAEAAGVRAGRARRV